MIFIQEFAQPNDSHSLYLFFCSRLPTKCFCNLIEIMASTRVKHLFMNHLQ